MESCEGFLFSVARLKSNLLPATGVVGQEVYPELWPAPHREEARDGSGDCSEK